MNVIVIGLALAVQAGHAAHGASSPSDTVPLYDNLGDHQYEISTEVPAAQTYFDQGLRLYYAFNHAEAIRSFREAQRLDDACAMCWWGEALAWGPNINMPMDSAGGVAAYAAVQHALELAEHANERERALIEALAGRYAANPPADRAALDTAYARAMADVAARYPDDSEAAVLYGESLMDLSPWEYWTAAGEPRSGTGDALAAFERVLATNADHPGACHFFIHAVEAVYPERAVACAERLAGLMPGAGHIVHMPGHIYIRVGRYMDAIEANQHAVHADETYIRDQRPGAGVYTLGYYPHNYDFMAFAASMAGRERMAIDAAEQVAALVPAEMIGAPGFDFLQHWMTRPLQMRVRFARWDEILDAPAPRADLPHALGMWHYARGRAFAAQGDVAAAQEELDALVEVAADPALDGMGLEFNLASDILGVGVAVLSGFVAEAQGDADAAIEYLGEAARLEDALVYGEPPEWSVPVREELGRLLLAAGRAVDAERVFLEDLERFPQNGWSLGGLAEALRAQGKVGEAAAVEARIDEEFGG